MYLAYLPKWAFKELNALVTLDIKLVFLLIKIIEVSSSFSKHGLSFCRIQEKLHFFTPSGMLYAAPEKFIRHSNILTSKIISCF